MLKWKAFIGDFNSKRIEEFDIFTHSGFLNSLREHAKTFDKDKDREKFVDMAERELLYFFWKKCEWETVITPWPPRDTPRSKKTDVYEQVMMNRHVFFDYLVQNYKELLPPERKRRAK